MITVILVVHIMLAVALTGVIMVQKSEGGALGMGGGGGMAGFMTGRSAANLLTRTTAILAACFFATSIALALLQTHQRAPSSIMEGGAPTSSAPANPAPGGPVVPTPSTAPQLPAANAPAGNAPASSAPAAPSTPAAPLAK
jgi:preprotein translocase subunit SecG